MLLALHMPFGNMNALRAAMGPHVAAVMIESVQGEGGANRCLMTIWQMPVPPQMNLARC